MRTRGGSTVLALLLAPGLAFAAPPPPRTVPRLAELDSELQALAMRVAPSVVQVLVSGFGPASAEIATAMLTPHRASGSGVVSWGSTP